MTAFDYPATAATATRLLTRFGAAATIRRPTGAAYDANAGTIVTTYATTATTAAVFAYDQKYIDGTLIKQGDQLAYCAPGVEPRPGDEFVWQAIIYTVIAVKPTSPAGVPVLFEAQIRG